MRRILTLTAALTALSALPALAEATFCTARINDRDVVLGYDTAEPGLDKNFSRRERIAARWGEHDCPSYVLMRALTPELTDDQRGPFCLRHDEATKSVIGYDLGERDAWGQCRQRSASVCERVNATRSAAGAMTSAAARGTLNGLRALPDGSGAVIMSGSGSVISGALSSLGTAAATVAASPALAAGAAVSVVAVGGAVYACSD
jgi:hypothetical protein